ncbi:MAG TPA: YbaY family lipoprotein [Candidatus Binatus sp.]|nr:YbaY family lipoprotein [Candidatus Binatus sp.]
MKPSRLATLALSLAAALCVVVALAPGGRAADIPRQLMTVGAPIAVPRAIGRFEQLLIDPKYRDLLAVHASSNELLFVNIDSGEIERRVVVGAGRSVAVDVYDGKIFVGTDDGYISQLNRRWFVENQRIYTSGPVGSIAFDPKNGRLYATHAGGSEVWVIQGKTDKILQFTVQVPKGATSIVYDPVSDRLYQNITSINSVVVIDPNTNSVTATYPLGDVTDPTGIAVDGKGRRLFSAGGNGKVAIVDLTNGKVIGTVAIAPRSDQLAYDDTLNKLYAASGIGLITVMGETGEGFDRIGDVTVPRGSHTLAIDPKTHNVWIAYGGDQNDYVVKLSPPTSPAPSESPTAIGSAPPAAGATSMAAGQVSGVVTYLARMALPPTAVLHVSIDDVSVANAPAVTISSVDIPVTHQVPIPFSVAYDPSKIDPKHTYALNARIESNGTLLFINKTKFPLFQSNAPTTGLTVRVDPAP